MTGARLLGWLSSICKRSTFSTLGSCQVYSPAFTLLPANPWDQTNGSGKLRTLCSCADVSIGADCGISHSKRR
ncbi:hypothetical protein D3C84_731480 [compost metagenome]